MKNLRFWSLSAGLGAIVLASAAWLSPVAHGQTTKKPGAVAEGPAAHKTVEDQAAGPEVRRLEMLLGDRGSRIGVSIRDLPDVDVKAGKSGVVIGEVTPDSPAATAGIKEGDLVTSFDGERVRSARQFARLVQETPSGRTVRAQVLRDGSTMELSVTPSAEKRNAELLQPGDMRHRFDFDVPSFKMVMPDLPEIAREWTPGEKFDVQVWARPGRLGVSVQGLTPELAEYFGVKEGVLVTSVTKESAAAKAGVKAGDVITSVDGKAVDDAGELRRQLRIDEGQPTEVTLGITRDRKPMSMKVPLEGRQKQEMKKPGRTV